MKIEIKAHGEERRGVVQASWTHPNPQDTIELVWYEISRKAVRSACQVPPNAAAATTTTAHSECVNRHAAHHIVAGVSTAKSARQHKQRKRKKKSDHAATGDAPEKSAGGSTTRGPLNLSPMPYR